MLNNLQCTSIADSCYKNHLFQVFSVCRYLQHTRNFERPKKLVISSIPVLRATVVISAIYLQLNKQLKQCDILNVSALLELSQKLRYLSYPHRKMQHKEMPFSGQASYLAINQGVSAPSAARVPAHTYNRLQAGCYLT